MNRPHSIGRWRCRFSRAPACAGCKPSASKRRLLVHLSLGFLLILPPVGLAAEVPLRAFTAEYDLYHSGMHVATSKLSLQPAGGAWRWILQSKTRGIYSLFADSKPYAETTFIQRNDEVQLQQIVVTDANNQKKFESAKFDWVRGELYVLRKGKHKSLPLVDGIYDYQSIHVLAAGMRLRRQKTASINFYRKGRLLKSRLVYTGQGTVALDGKAVEADIFEQVMTQSDSKLRYYYDAKNPLLPLRIERLEPGDGPTIMTLNRVDWTL